MKILKVTSVLALVFIMLSCSQERTAKEKGDIPEPVLKSFQADNPDAKDAKWEKDGELYVVEYDKDSFEKEVVYDVNGKVVEWEIEIPVESLPQAIIDYIDVNYPDFIIIDAEKIETKEGLFYGTDIESGEDLEMELVFDEQGQFIKEEGDDDDGDMEEDDDGNEIEIAVEDLPTSIIDDIMNNYPGAELLEADQITHGDGSITYDVEMKHEGTVIEVMYDSEANFLGIEQDEGDDEGKEDD